MRKLKKRMLFVLTLGMAAAFAVSCGGNGGGNQGANSNSQQQSESVESTDSSESVDGSDSDESSSESVDSSDSDESSSESVDSSDSDESSSESVDGSDSDESSSEIVDSSDSDESGEIVDSSDSDESSSETVDSSDSDESSSEDDGEHVCITEGQWTGNSTGHWLVCTCGELVEYSSHSGTAPDCESQPVCDTCGKSYGKAPGHTYGELSDGDYGKAYYCDCGAYITNADLVDFVVEVESDRDPVVLQLSDTQICDWGDLEEMCYRYVREVVEKTDPDLIILTGDVVYGRFDPNGTLLTSLIEFMETLKTPWAPVFGNHDNESLKGVDWQCDQFEAAEYCLFKQGDVTGNGNYSVGIEQDGELLRVFYMMDSNGCGKPMCDRDGVQTTPAAGTNVVMTSQGFAQDQIDWYTDQINEIHALDADVKISMAYHIQQSIFKKAFEKYEEYDGLTTDSALDNPLNLDTMETAEDTDFGYVGRPMKGGWDYSYTTFNKMKALGVDSIFVGHEHCNSSSIVYEGVRLQYGQKSSTYDRYNSLNADGTITGASSTPAGATPLIGGTVIPISGEDGSIGTGYIVYYGYDGSPFETNGDNTESGTTETPEETPAVTVEGLQYGTDITAQSDESSSFGSFEAVAYDENTNAYYVVSGTSYNRIYINASLLKGKSTVSFDILVPEEATNTDGSSAQEFAIRVKPNPTTEQLPGVTDGYLWFDASYTGDRSVTIGEWQTITVDISAFADVCTEFGIYFVAGGNSAYVKNIAVS